MLQGFYEDGHQSVRKPDIVLVFLKAAALAHKSRQSQDLWGECVAEATFTSRDHFKHETLGYDEWWKWVDVLQPWELKAKAAIKLPRNNLKTKFDVKLLPGKALHVPDSGMDEDATEASSASRDVSAQPVSKGSAKGPDTLPPRKSARLASANPGSTPASGSGGGSGSDSHKRKASSTGANQGSSKKSKGDASSHHPSVQSALYGVERLCCHMSIAHATGMVVVGMYLLYILALMPF